MSDTHPTEIGRRIREEVQATLERVRDEDTYRREMLIGMTEVRIRQEAHAREMMEHRDDDRRQFEQLWDKIGSVTQNINNNRSIIDKGVGVVVCVVALLGFAMWLIDRLST